MKEREREKELLRQRKESIAGKQSLGMRFGLCGLLLLDPRLVIFFVHE